MSGDYSPSVYTSDGSDPLDHADLGSEVADANARLIASAPELYQRLTEAREAIASLDGAALGCGTVCDHNGDPEYYPIRDELLVNIDTALAKASGDIPSGRSQ